MEDNTTLQNLFLGLPFLAAGLFLFNHSDWVAENPDFVFPLMCFAGAVLIYKIFPDLFQQLKTLVPVLGMVGIILGAFLYLVFGGGADAVVGFGAKAREQHIESLK